MYILTNSALLLNCVAMNVNDVCPWTLKSPGFFAHSIFLFIREAKNVVCCACTVENKSSCNDVQLSVVWSSPQKNQQKIYCFTAKLVEKFHKQNHFPWNNLLQENSETIIEMIKQFTNQPTHIFIVCCAANWPSYPLVIAAGQSIMHFVLGGLRLDMWKYNSGLSSITESLATMGQGYTWRRGGFWQDLFRQFDAAVHFLEQSIQIRVAWCLSLVWSYSPFHYVPV